MRDVRRPSALIPLMVAVLLVGCAQATPSQPASRGTPPLIQGTGTGQSVTFGLTGGDYKTTWIGIDKGTSSVGCFLGLILQQTGGGAYVEMLANQTIPPGLQQTATSHLHDVPPGNYYIAASTRCSWAVQMVPE
jgi:hypothetical protein